VLSGELTRWCCIDRLNWHDLSSTVGEGRFHRPNQRVDVLRLRLRAPEIITLVNPAQILVQPREDILNQFGSSICNIVRRIQHDVALVLRW
jgi:hypothetical protein